MVRIPNVRYSAASQGSSLVWTVHRRSPAGSVTVA
jgi:hypothetical protein